MSGNETPIEIGKGSGMDLTTHARQQRCKLCSASFISGEQGPYCRSCVVESARGRFKVVRREDLEARDRRRCKICGVDRPRNFTKPYCDSACEWLAGNQLEPAIEPTRCLHCDEPVTSPRVGRPRKYCDDACRIAAHRANAG